MFSQFSRANTTLGENCIRIPDCTASNFILKGHRINASWRANICAMQIVERKNLILTGDQTIAAADYAGSSLNIINTGGTLTTLTVEGALSTATLVFSGNPFTLKLSQPATALYAAINTGLTFDITTLPPDASQAITLLTGPTVKGETGSIALIADPLTHAVPSVTAAGISAFTRRALPGAGANAISINLGAINSYATLAEKTGNVGLYPVDASRWIDLAGLGNRGSVPTETVLETLTDNFGTAYPGTALKLCSNAATDYVAAFSDSATASERFFRRYLADDGGETNAGTNACGFVFTNVPFAKYAVIAYYSFKTTDANIFAAPQINGAYHTGDPTLSITRPAAAPTAYWGLRAPTALEGQNCLVAAFSTNDHPHATLINPVKLAYGKHSNLCGLQIVDMTSLDTAQSFTATLPGGPVSFSQIAWDNQALFTDNSANTVFLTLLADTTLTLDTPLALRDMRVTGPANLRLLSNGSPVNVSQWNFQGLSTLEINTEASTYTPAPIATPPQTILYTTPTTQTLATATGQNIELRAGTPENRADYTVTYAGGDLRILSGAYTYTAPGTATQTSLEIGGTADLRFGTNADGNFAIGKMNATISGGTLTAGRLISSQGVATSPGHILQTGGHITLTYEGDYLANRAPLLLGNQKESPSTYTMTGGSLTAAGPLCLTYDSQADVFIQGGLLQIEGIIGSQGTFKSLTLSGGELSLGHHGINLISNALLTVAGGELTARLTPTNAVQTAFTARQGTASTLSAAPGATLEFKQPLHGSGDLRIGNAEKGRSGTVTLNNGELTGAITVENGTLKINGTLGTTPGFGPVTHRYLRLTVTDWPRTNPNGNLTSVNTGIVISEIILKNNGQTVPWGSGKAASSVPTAAYGFWPGSMTDGDYYNAFVCNTTPADGKYVIVIDRGSTTAPFNSYQILAGEKNGRVPLAWTLETSSDKSTWLLLDTQTLNLESIVTWNSEGGDAATIGPNQARTFPQPPAAAPTLAIGTGATLTGTGATAHTLAFQAGSILLKAGEPTEALTALGTVTLPGEGTVGAPIPQGASHTQKYYLLRGPATETLDLDRFTPTDGFRIDRDADGIFLRLRNGTILTLY